MSETELKEVSIDTLPMKEFKEARSKGVLTVPAKVNHGERDDDVGDETVNSEVSAQDETGGEDEKSVSDRPRGKGEFQKSSSKLIREKSSLEERATAAERKAAELEPSSPKTNPRSL